MARYEPLAIAHVADEIAHARILLLAEILRMSNCFNSSRLKIISFCGVWSRKTVATNCLPKEPVPPVTITTLFSRQPIVEFIIFTLAGIACGCAARQL